MNKVEFGKDGCEVEEIVFLNPRSIHIERMDNDQWWIGIDDGNGRLIHLGANGWVSMTYDSAEE